MNTIETALRSYRYLLQKHHPEEVKQIACATAALEELTAQQSVPPEARAVEATETFAQKTYGTYDRYLINEFRWVCEYAHESIKTGNTKPIRGLEALLSKVLAAAAHLPELEDEPPTQSQIMLTGEPIEMSCGVKPSDFIQRTCFPPGEVQAKPFADQSLMEALDDSGLMARPRGAVVSSPPSSGASEAVRKAAEAIVGCFPGDADPENIAQILLQHGLGASEDTARKYVRTEFINRMDAELIANERKGDWDKFSPKRYDCYAWIMEHINKLCDALHEQDRVKVSEFCADVANIAMKIDVTFGAKQEDIDAAMQQKGKKP